MTLLEVFKTYPLIVSDIARHHGYSREWLKGLMTGRMYLSPEKRAAHMKMIQAYINKIGREMAEIKLTDV